MKQWQIRRSARITVILVGAMGVGLFLVSASSPHPAMRMHSGELFAILAGVAFIGFALSMLLDNSEKL